jgi:hypothetical protein
MLLSLLSLGSIQTLQLQMDHMVLRKVDTSILAKMPEGSKNGFGRVNGILDETGTYVFTTIARFNMNSGIVAPYRTLVPYTGKKPYPDTYGDMVSNWTVGIYPDLSRYMLQETKQVFHSDDGASLWVESHAWKASSASTFGKTWLSGSKPGYTGYLNSVYAHLSIRPAMGTDGKSFALLRSKLARIKPTKQPGHHPPVSGRADIALDRFGSPRLEIHNVPTSIIGNEGLKIVPFHSDQARRVILGWEINTARSSNHRIMLVGVPQQGATTVRYLIPPEKRKVRSFDGSVNGFFVSNAWITRKRGNILVQMLPRTSMPAEGEGPMQSLWLYQTRTKKWRKVGDYKVWAWSGSNKLFLVGGSEYKDPSWVIRLEE